MFRSAFLAAVMTAGAVGYVHDSGSLIVNSPKSLADLYARSNGSINQRPAMFGIPAHGHQAQMTGRVVYVPTDDFEGCQAINKAELPSLDGMGLVIMVVERGNCTFVTKVKHAQDVGASGCIIVDNKEEQGLPYMADDGHGSVISIPAMLIHKDDGAIINATLAGGEDVLLTMAWNTPHPDNIVEWQIWTSADDIVTSSLKQEIRTFKTDFDSAAHVLGDAAYMEPHYFIATGVWMGCLQTDDTKPLPCGDMCTNQGRYCSFNLDGDSKNGLVGAKVVEENLRQICIFRALNSTGSGVKWWDYIEDFMNECKDYTAECAERVMSGEKVGLVPAVVNKCMEDAGGLGPRAGANTILNAEIKLRAELGIWSEPTILINGIAYRGSLTCPLPIDVTHCGVLATICMGFLDQSKIPACQSSPGCPLGQMKDECGICGGTGEIDACGECNQLESKLFNSSCKGCDLVANSGLSMDRCLICGGPGPDRCGNCQDVVDGVLQGEWIEDESKCSVVESQGISTGVAVGIAVPVIIVLALLVFAYVRYRQRLFKQDVDALLAQYLPMADGVGQVAKSGAVQQE